MSNPTQTDQADRKVSEKPMSAVDAVHHVLSESLDSLHSWISELESRLEPVKTSFPMKEGNAIESHGSSTVVSRIDGYVNLVESAKDRIKQLIDELEV